MPLLIGYWKINCRAVNAIYLKAHRTASRVWIKECTADPLLGAVLRSHAPCSPRHLPALKAMCGKPM
ncbi:hypothetical protein PhaeoP75_03885 (plasmid) [Phaeobacter gallaeciensis]|uniref:Uncharacterized protein n=1 Tax=Phaeobacter gallaeciensis TaxID=60890 RepID=A0AAD0EF18_9RHOB|nr:hypothetical protein Gal_03850 [Phaeobacter gallaeciensis DSM 26640]ATE94822.1 hypothetical protein PhaeoP11_03836 [Phaeobacter gallaeciensis]ATE99093.1 hypothetical protein PhaeoP73_03832 [Phaeobacter gallaeciensis]ATF03486.1 hypothetical protein PhaeoP75_03885 [Phaeobacter gallaeciensis]ATF07866.1 hypothetical protein PhaeoP63_03834 [Phaeobacter gallaeciensis]